MVIILHSPGLPCVAPPHSIAASGTTPVRQPTTRIGSTAARALTAGFIAVATDCVRSNDPDA